MRRVLDVYEWLKRAYRRVMRWYDAVRRFVTKRSVYFPTLGVAVFTAILLAFVTRQAYYEMAAVFVTTFAALVTTRVTRGKKPNSKFEADDAKTEPR